MFELGELLGVDGPDWGMGSRTVLDEPSVLWGELETVDGVHGGQEEDGRNELGDDEERAGKAEREVELRGIELNREAPQLAARFLCAATLQANRQDMQYDHSAATTKSVNITSINLMHLPLL